MFFHGRWCLNVRASFFDFFVEFEDCRAILNCKAMEQWSTRGHAIQGTNSPVSRFDLAPSGLNSSFYLEPSRVSNLIFLFLRGLCYYQLNVKRDGQCIFKGWKQIYSWFLVMVCSSDLSSSCHHTFLWVCNFCILSHYVVFLQICQNGRLAVSKLVTSLTRAVLTKCLLIRYTCQVDSGNAYMIYTLCMKFIFLSPSSFNLARGSKSP